jgi:hypothetical protein
MRAGRVGFSCSQAGFFSFTWNNITRCILALARTPKLLFVLDPHQLYIVTYHRHNFGLVIGFIGSLQVITTNNYNTIADLHNLQSLHMSLLVKSSQADFMYSSSTTKYPWLTPIEN